MRLLQLVGDGLPDLTADRDVVNARLGNFRLLKEVLSVESDLIVEDNYVFASEPLQNLLLRLANDALNVGRVAHVERD